LALANGRGVRGRWVFVVRNGILLIDFLHKAVAANLSFNVLRAKRRGQPVQLEIACSEDGEPFYRDVPDARHVPPHDRLDAEELRGKVGDAINQLPENQKVAIILSKY
jgi:DNA-directed RNA polymerase specialized sigma24 family protein